MEDFGNFYFQSLVMGLNNTGSVCSLRGCKVVQHGFNGTTCAQEDFEPFLPLNSQKFEQNEFPGHLSMPMEQSDVILENSINNEIENRRKIDDWTRKFRDASSSLKQSQFEENDPQAWRAMPSKLSDFALEISTNDATRQNGLFCVPNFTNFRSKGNKANQQVTSTNETKQQSFQSYLDVLMDIDSHPGVTESFNSGSTVLSAGTPDNRMFTDYIDNTFSEDRQSLLEVFTVLDSSIQPFFHQGMTTSSKQDEIRGLSSFTRNFSANDTMDQTSFEKLPLNGIRIAPEQEKSGERSATETYRHDSKDPDQSKSISSSQRKDVSLKDLPSRPTNSNGRDQQKTNSYRRTHREHVNYLQRKRVEKLNHGYKCLHASLPPHLAGQKLSKLEILIEAIRYIRLLDNILMSCEDTDRL